MVPFEDSVDYEYLSTCHLTVTLTLPVYYTLLILYYSFLRLLTD